jgi:hypothetical protein
MGHSSTRGVAASVHRAPALAATTGAALVRRVGNGLQVPHGIVHEASVAVAARAGDGLAIGFFETWNECVFAVTSVTDPSLWVTSVGLASRIGCLEPPIETMMSGAVVFALPSVIVLLDLRRCLVAGLVAGAIRFTAVLAPNLPDPMTARTSSAMAASVPGLRNAYSSPR